MPKMTYNFSKTIEYIENEDTMTKVQFSKDVGITTATVYSWVDRANNDLQEKESYYGKAYFDMYRDGISPEYVKSSMEASGLNIFARLGLVFGDRLFLVPDKSVNYVKTASWYKVLEDNNYIKAVKYE